MIKNNATSKNLTKIQINRKSHLRQWEESRKCNRLYSNIFVRQSEDWEKFVLKSTKHIQLHHI